MDRNPDERPHPTKKPSRRPRAAEPAKRMRVLTAPTDQNATLRGKRRTMAPNPMARTTPDAARFLTTSRPSLTWTANRRKGIAGVERRTG